LAAWTRLERSILDALCVLPEHWWSQPELLILIDSHEALLAMLGLGQFQREIIKWALHPLLLKRTKGIGKRWLERQRLLIADAGDLRLRL
jgi:hypothetical protein